MKKYPFNCYGIDQYIYAVNDSAYRMISKSGHTWPFGTDPVYPLNWYIASGRAPTQFIHQLLSVRPDVIARVLIKGGSDQEIVQRIKKRVGSAPEAMKEG